MGIGWVDNELWRGNMWIVRTQTISSCKIEVYNDCIRVENKFGLSIMSNESMRLNYQSSTFHYVSFCNQPDS